MRTLSTILLTCLLPFIFVSTVPAQWVQTSLDSQSVLCLAASDTNLFAGTFNGVFLSTNNGQSWSAINAGLRDTDVYALAISGTYLFAGTQYGGVFVSSNGGTTWTHSGLANNRVSDFADGGTNFFASTLDSGIFVSTDNGSSWNPRNIGIYPGFATSLTVSGNRLFAGTDGGIYLSTDNGTTWVRLYEPEYPGVYDLVAVDSVAFAVVSGFRSSGVVRSTDNGLSWEPANAGLSSHHIRTLAMFGRILFAGGLAENVFVGDRSVFVSTDDGDNWTSVDAGLSDTNTSALAVSGSYLFAGTEGGVWRRPLSEMITDVQPSRHDLPIEYSLHQNYPNPFNPTTTISYQLPKQCHVTLGVLDMLGREVAALVNGVEQPGHKSINFDASRLSSGMYFYRLQAGNYIETKKLVLLK